MSAIVITHSDIAAFLKCRRSWRWGWLEDRNPGEPFTGYFAVGHRIHKAILDGWYGAGADPIVYHDQLAAWAIEQVELGVEGVKPWDINEIYSDVVVSRNAVAAYVDWLEDTGADHGEETLSVEQTVEMPILDGRVILRGKTDRHVLDRASGHHVIEDLKSTGRAVSQLEVELEKSYQGYIYRLINAALEPDVHVRASRYRIIEKTKNLKPNRTYVHEFTVPGMLRASPNVLRQVEGICAEMLSVIDRAGISHPDHVMYPTPGEHCAWCPFRNPCLVTQQDPAAGAAMLDDHFAPGRHRRYDAASSAS